MMLLTPFILKKNQNIQRIRIVIVLGSVLNGAEKSSQWSKLSICDLSLKSPSFWAGVPKPHARSP